MADVKTRVIIDANASNAIKEIDKLDESAEAADKTIKKLDDQTVAVDVNADGMDELRRKGEEAVAQIKAMSDQKVTIDVDADKLDRIAPAADGARGKVDDLGKSADSSKSVLANMVGNTTQDLGELGGVAGSAGVAIGQMGEYMADAAGSGEKMGSILKNFAGVAGPILVISAAVKEFSDTMAKAAKVKAFRKQEVEDYTKALKETDTTLGAIKAKLEEDEGIFANWFGSEEDVSAVFTGLGLGVGQVAELIAGGTTKIDAWAAALRAAGVDGDTTAIAAGILKQNVEDLAASQEAGAATTQFLTDTTDAGTASWHAAKDAVKEMADGLDGSAESTRNVTQKTRALTTAYQDAKQAANDLTYANQLLRGDISQDSAYLHLQDTFDDVKAKGQDAMDAVKNGASDADAKMRIYQTAVNDARLEVIDFNTTWGTVDTDKTLEMDTKISRGELDSVLVDVGKATSTTHWIDVKVRTTVDQAWTRVMGNRF